MIDRLSYEGNFPGAEVTAEEWEFLRAMERYQRRYGRRYPTWREVLAVLRSLGYRRDPPPGDPPPPPPPPAPRPDRTRRKASAKKSR